MTVSANSSVTTTCSLHDGGPFLSLMPEMRAVVESVGLDADAMLGVVTCTKDAWAKLRSSTYELGQTAGPEDVYLAQRGLRTLAVRLKQHWQAGVALAEWVGRQREVERVLYPALPGDPGHAIWKRDFTGACGLFGVVLKEGVSDKALSAMIDGLEL